MIFTEKKKDMYGRDVTRLINEKRQLIGSVLTESNAGFANSVYTALDWEGCRIWWSKSQRRDGPVQVYTFIEAKKAVLDYYESHMDDFLAHIRKMEEEKAEKAAMSGASAMKMLTDGNDSFYPTPDKLAGKMMGKIKTPFTSLVSVLEPSAGKGDLLTALDKYTSSNKRGRYKEDGWLKETCDVIESDLNLQCLLRGKGFRVVCDDFLGFSSAKYYSLIIMNPPFDAGDQHLLKAISLQERCGGEIVCLLNAETVRNPYTNIRKVLQQKLAEHCADIEFVSDAFKHAERKTDVEVAIVHFNIPRRMPKKDIFEGMRRAKEKVCDEMEQQGLTVTGDSVHELLGQYNAEATAGLNIISEFCNIAPTLNHDAEYHEPLELHVGDWKLTGGDPMPAYNKFLSLLRARYWKMLFDSDELRSKMTSAMATDYSSKLHEMRNFDFSEYNIRQLLFELQSQLVEGIEESIMSLFTKLSEEYSYLPETKKNIHYYNGWRTNMAHKVGPRAIIPLNGFHCHWDKSYSLDTYSIGHVISDLERALSYLDKGEVAFHHNVSAVLRQAEACEEYKNVDFTYFTCDFYKKGTCHIKFKPEAQPIVDRLNIFGSQRKGWLPPRYGKVHYKDMSKEEQAVVADFQGEAKYEAVVREPDKWLLTSGDYGIKMLTA